MYKVILIVFFRQTVYVNENMYSQKNVIPSKQDNFERTIEQTFHHSDWILTKPFSCPRWDFMKFDLPPLTLSVTEFLFIFL